VASIYTIGHGRHAFAGFFELLQKHDIKFACDVRSVARSRWPQNKGLVVAEPCERERERIHFISALPMSPQAKGMLGVIRSAYPGENPGDLSVLENSNPVDETHCTA